jgi:KAP family P-loop domain protein
MKCKLQKLDIPDKNPFLNCQLGREKYADILKAIVLTYNEGCVLAINGKWGTGKTTFVEMWAKYLKLDNFHTLYFNAWENDFISDPIVGLLGELKKVSSQKMKEDALLSVISTAGKIVLKAAPAIAKGILKKYAGEDVVDICSDSIEEGASLLKEEIESYQKQKLCLEQFHIELSKFVEDICDDKPLVFIVDELDRCNPYYAVKVLERIKHLFNIPNIVFVISIDKQQLSNSIRGYYGSDLIDADEYLKRFIDIEYTLPEPDVDKFSSYLYKFYDFDTFFAAEERSRYFERNSEQESLLKVAQALFKHKKMTLRQVEKIFTNTRLSLKMFLHNEYVCPDLLFLLTYFHICESELYEKICHKDYDIQGLVSQIENSIPQCIFKVDESYNRYPNRFFLFTIAQLIVCYAVDGYARTPLMTKKEQNKDRELLFTVQFMNKKILIEALDWTETRYREIFALSHITNKISLLENFKN